VTLTAITPSTGASATEKETRAEVARGVDVGGGGGGFGVVELLEELPPQEDKIQLLNNGIIYVLILIISITLWSF